MNEVWQLILGIAFLLLIVIFLVVFLNRRKTRYRYFSSIYNRKSSRLKDPSHPRTVTSYKSPFGHKKAKESSEDKAHSETIKRGVKRNFLTKQRH
jgi:hypothetical protein